MNLTLPSHLSRRLGGTVLTGGAVLALAACGSDDGGSSPSPTGASSSSSAATSVAAGVAAGAPDPAKTPSLVLPADEFPAGYQVQQIPPAQIQAMADQILAATKGAEIKPASCAQLQLLPKTINTKEIGLAVATATTTNLGTSVSVPQVDMAAQRKSVSGKCGRLTMTFTSGIAKGATGSVEQKVVPAPKSKADDALVVVQSTKTKVGENTSNTKGRMGIALVNGYQVTVQLMSMTGQDVDKKVFDEFFVKAVNRVAGQTD